MNILFHLFLLIPMISTTPIPLTNRQLAVLEYMALGATNETDIIAYSMKMLEEYSNERRFGLTGDDYFRVCADRGFFFTFRERHMVVNSSKPLDFNAPKLFNSTDEIIKGYEKEFPEILKFVNQRVAFIKQNMQKLDSDSQEFLRMVEKTLYDAIYKERDENDVTPALYRTFIGRRDHFNKIMDEYNVLPQATKKVLEQKFCFFLSFGYIYVFYVSS